LVERYEVTLIFEHTEPQVFILGKTPLVLYSNKYTTTSFQQEVLWHQRKLLVTENTNLLWEITDFTHLLYSSLQAWCRLGTRVHATMLQGLLRNASGAS